MLPLLFFSFLAVFVIVVVVVVVVVVCCFLLILFSALSFKFDLGSVSSGVIFCCCYCCYW